MSNTLHKVDQVRKRISGQTSAAKKAALGQYMTPAPVARFMASMFPPVDAGEVLLLDAGAGVGSLSSAFLDRLFSERGNSAHVIAFELDAAVLTTLRETLSAYDRVRHEVVHGDFIQRAVFDYRTGNAKAFTHAILNPPYQKIGTDSSHRHLLRKIGLETVNLYTGFLAVSLLLLQPGGLLCAITPRSFCNGPYYRPFREFMRHHAALRRIHLFGSRKRAFAEEGILQENVITLWERCGVQKDVEISTSADSEFADLDSHSLPFDRIVRPGDLEGVFHIPTSFDVEGHLPSTFCHSLESLGIHLSTGPVVDFRLREHLHQEPTRGAVPLLYPTHFSSQGVEWPKIGNKKPNAIARNSETEKWLYPAGNYTLVRRFSSKEERRRVVATFLAEDALDYPMIGLENHLNVFHIGRRGLPRNVARGLAVYLNSTMLDLHFRVFNGHTQVNATDLRNVPYPSMESLVAMGRWANRRKQLTQEAIDKEVSRYA